MIITTKSISKTIRKTLDCLFYRAFIHLDHITNTTPNLSPTKANVLTQLSPIKSHQYHPQLYPHNTPKSIVPILKITRFQPRSHTAPRTWKSRSLRVHERKTRGTRTFQRRSPRSCLVYELPIRARIAHTYTRVEIRWKSLQMLANYRRAASGLNLLRDRNGAVTQWGGCWKLW